ncbi:cytochrome P450 302a1, mitochondrial [Uranotaenia lowii]|uniref:cytochrome P450 302a1, mitochondrial n=1 Tax=Uranotaenia lowii TaxID=190385 RepID=UPI002479C99F|nr:cytochrome P450 302a1, mitochondrial [Uranotaenia lowii]
MLSKYKRFKCCSFATKLKNEIRIASFCSAPKPFDAIPGPRGPFGMGNLYQYLPGIGNYSFDALHQSGLDKYQRYGPIVRETMVPGHDIVWLYDPQDIATVLNDSTPGVYPKRRSHLALAKYRRDRPNVYRTVGLLPSQGLEWWRIRSELQKGLSSPQSVRNFLPLIDSVTKKFVGGIKPHAEGEEIDDFLPHLSRFSLEITCLLAFDYHLNSFSDEQMLPDSIASRLMESARTTNENILRTDQGFQLWRLFETPSYRRIRKSQEYIEKIAVELVSQKLMYFDEDRQKLASGDHKSRSLLEEYLRNPNLELNDIIGMAGDLLLAGVHTTSFTMSFVLYHLALNPEVQQKLYEEGKKVLPNPWVDKIETATLNSEISYCRAVLKESMRLNPVSVGVGRVLNLDTVLGGYSIPKDTTIVTQNFTSCRLEKYFRDPLKFNPDRWMRGETKENVSPYLVLPFGHGMRSCIARRMAEQQMLVLIVRLIRSYSVEWAGTVPMDVVTKLINEPDQPVKLIFKTRKD